MQKVRIRYAASILLVLMFVLTPLRFLRAADAEATYDANGGSVSIYTVKNNTNKEMIGWTITIKGVPEGAVVQNAWNASCSLSGGTLTFTSNQDWNSNIPANSSVYVSVGCYMEIAGPDGNYAVGTWSPTSVTVTPKFGASTNTPTPVPATPTPIPTAAPTAAPTVAPTAAPTAAPTVAPTAAPVNPTAAPAETTPAPTDTTTTEVTETTLDPNAGIAVPVAGDDWLTTDGNKIVDQNGTQVWLTGINWFGYNTGTNVFDGCWNCNMDAALKAIADHGFNLLRIPMSAELVLNWKNGIYPEANFNQANNAELVGMNSQQIFDYALSLCQKYGIKVMLDIHSANTDASGHMANLWYTDKVSIQDYYDSLSYLADRYKDNDTIVAYDLKNEPHGKPNEDKAIWNDSELDNNWKHVAEVAGNLVLDQNPNALIVIEGIEIYPKDLSTNADYSSTSDADYYYNWWGANLRGVKDYPIDFGSPERNKQIVYSPHDYGPTVYEQPWFQGSFDYESLNADCWNDNWLYIHNEGIAPILIGEWGGFMQEPNLTWMTYLRQLIGENHLNFTFWCFNSNSGDTGGLVLDDFTTWDEDKSAFVKEVLWQDEGKFVGLDHAVPLGDNGIALSQYSGTIVSVVPDVTPVPSGEVTDPSESGAESKPAAAAAATAASSSGISAGKIILYCFMFLLIALVAVIAYLIIKRPKDWNNLVDRLHLPEKLKRDIPWEIIPETGALGTTDSASKNNEFAGRFRPVKKETPDEVKPKSVEEPKTEEGTEEAASSPFKPSPFKPAGTAAAPSSTSQKAPIKRPNMRPAAPEKPKLSLEEEVARLAEEMKAEAAAHEQAALAAESGLAAAPVVESIVPDITPEPVIEPAPKTEEEEIPSIVRSMMKEQAPEPEPVVEEPEEEAILPTWAQAMPTDRPIWAKPANTETAEAPQERKGPIKRPNLRPAANKPNEPKNDKE